VVLNLKPYAFSIGPIKIYWYGIFMGISFLIGTYYLLQQGRKKGLDEDFLLNLAIITLLGGIVGARLVFVMANFPYWFINNPIQVLKIYQGGLAWHGGLLGGLLSGITYAYKKKQNVNMLMDLTVPGLAAGYMLVRIGNIFNQEVLGRTTQLGFERWPAQLIGSGIGLVLLIRYFILQKKDIKPGYQFWSFIFYHQLLRGLVEETIRDNPLFIIGYLNTTVGIGFFTLTHLITPAVLILAYIMMKRSYSFM